MSDAADRGLESKVAAARARLASRGDGLSAGQRALLAKRLGGKLDAGARRDLANRSAARPEATRPAGFAEILGEAPLDLAAEAVLDPALVPEPAAVAFAGTAPGDAAAAGRHAACQTVRPPAAVLLTGATGFLGTYLLAELLRQTASEVFCLVRAASAEEGAARLRRSLEAHEVWDESAAARIRVVTGDLGRPRLGLPAVELDRLAAGIDLIVHNGAWVNASMPYATLEPINVLGTEELIRLACRARPKPLHLISTFDVFYAPEYSRLDVIEEDDPLAFPHGAASGYAQSKWVSEKKVAEARRRGLDISVHRFGRVSWHSRSGIWNPDDTLRRVLDACLEIGGVPDLEVGLALTPVDFIARAVVALALAGDAGAGGSGGRGRNFHLLNPRLVSTRQLAVWMRAAGRDLAVLPDVEWLDAARGLLPAALVPDLARLRGLASSTGESNEGEEGGDRGARREIDCRNAVAALAEQGVSCPEIGEEAVRAYLSRTKARPSAPPLA
jgi:thioester reductase-like protein